MKRIAAPMVGGLVTSAFLTLEIIPVIYTYWRNEQLLWRRLDERAFPILRWLQRNVIALKVAAALRLGWVAMKLYVESPPPWSALRLPSLLSSRRSRCSSPIQSSGNRAPVARTTPGPPKGADHMTAIRTLIITILAAAKRVRSAARRHRGRAAPRRPQPPRTTLHTHPAASGEPQTFN